jgi:hypothetical protein
VKQSDLVRERARAFAARDREELLAMCARAYPGAVEVEPPAAFLDDILDMLGYRVVRRELEPGTMAVCEFERRVIAVNTRLAERCARTRTWWGW